MFPGWFSMFRGFVGWEESPALSRSNSECGEAPCTNDWPMSLSPRYQLMIPT